MADATRELKLNLRLLCSHHRSVAEICRHLGINRQQFNKYLAGTSVPSARNLLRIAEFFHVEERDLFLGHDDFARRVISAPAPLDLSHGLQNWWSAKRAKSDGTQIALKRYCGFYHLHFRSPAWPDQVIRSIAVIYQRGGVTYIKNVERLMRKHMRHLGNYVVKYRGIVFMEAGRIFTLDSPEVGEGTVALMVLYPSQRRQLVLLYGLVLAVTAGSGRQPYASRIALTYLGEAPDLRRAIAACGVHPLDCAEIDREIAQAVSSEVNPRDGALVALQI